MYTPRIFKTLIVVCCSCIVLTACNSATASSKGASEGSEQVPGLTQHSEELTITYKIIPSQNDTFGYNVFLNGKLLIHQPNKPALAGNNGFATKEQAQIVAEFVSQKIRNNEMPPTVTLEDLKRLGVLK